MQPPPRPGFPPQFPPPPPQPFPNPGNTQPRSLVMGFAPQIVRQPTGGANPSRSTTLWVGKIAPSISSTDIRSILETCGTIKEWKPATDPKTGAIKGFGFCTFHSPESVIIAMDLLNGLVIDGQELALKCNSATEQFISWYKVSNAEKIESQLPPWKDDARQKLDSIIKSRPQVADATDASVAASDFLVSLSKPPRELHEKGEKRQREENNEEEKHRSHRPARQQQEREENRQYKERLHALELRERERLRDARRFREREKDAEYERQRQIKVDNEGFESDDEKEPWERRPYYESRRAAERRKRLEREMQFDKEDIRMEMQRKEERRKKAERDAKLAAEKKASHIAESLPVSDEVGIKATPSESLLEAAIKHVPQPQQQQQQQHRRRALSGFDEDEENRKVDKERKLIPIQYTEEELRGVECNDGDDAQKSKGGSKHSSKQRSMKDSKNKKEVDPEIAKRKLVMSKIPKDKDGVFAYEVKWKYYDLADDAIKNRIISWVSKKIKELMGEEESSFCDFIMSSIKAHEDAEQMYSKLKEVLDEDASSFVTKLFQVIIYETEKLAAA